MSAAKTTTLPCVELDPNLCLKRQADLAERAAAQGAESILILDRRHVHYLTGFWARSVFLPALLLRSGHRARLALPYEWACAAADVVTFDFARQGTIVDDPAASALKALDLTASDRLASDVAVSGVESIDLAPTLRLMRRSKWPDEVALLRRAVGVAEAGYAYARRAVQPGLTELELYAGLLAELTIAAGEPIGELGNDFQSGAPGGPPRNRAMQEGELLPLDLGVNVRGYTADLCRTFAVGGRVTQAQRDAHAKVIEVLQSIEAKLVPGASCRALHAWARKQLDGFGGASFGHHLGHGTGLSPHESPRLNDAWDDVLMPGDVFTVEPGLYHDSLRAGLRIEQMFYVNENGYERLSQFPTGLTDE